MKEKRRPMFSQPRHQAQISESQSSQDNTATQDHDDEGTTTLSWPEYLSVKEAARILNVSERSVYGYLEKQKLPFTHQGNLLVIETAAVRRFQRQAAGRPRTRQPTWHCSRADNEQLLTHITVQVRSGQQQALAQCLKRIQADSRHHLPGTIARYIAWGPIRSQHVQIVLVWRKAAMPPKEEILSALESFYDDFSLILDWQTAVVEEGEMLLHT